MVSKGFDVTELKPNFITVDDFRTYWGVDLINEFSQKGMANPSITADVFLYRVETRLKAYIDTNTFRRYERNTLNSIQQKYFCMALLEQAYYVYRNSDIASDSGYDPDKGIIAEKEILQDLAISEPAKQYLIASGLWSKQIKPRLRTGGFWNLSEQDTDGGFDNIYSEAKDK